MPTDTQAPNRIRPSVDTVLKSNISRVQKILNSVYLIIHFTKWSTIFSVESRDILSIINFQLATVARMDTAVVFPIIAYKRLFGVTISGTALADLMRRTAVRCIDCVAWCRRMTYHMKQTRDFVLLWLYNPYRPEIICEKKIYILHFLPFVKSEMAQKVEILPHRRQGPVYLFARVIGKFVIFWQIRQLIFCVSCFVVATYYDDMLDHSAYNPLNVS